MNKSYDKVFDEYLTHLDRVSDVVSIADKSNDLLRVYLEAVKKSHFTGEAIEKEINKIVQFIDSIKNEKLKEKYSIIYNQSIVLLIGYMETYFKDLYKIIINDYPEIINWGDKKKMNVDLDVIKFSKNVTVGDLIVNASNGNNFQDLQSTFRFLENTLSLTDVSLDAATRDNIIFYQAVRHAIVHNSSKFDAKLLRQIRNTVYADYLKDKKEGDSINLDYGHYENAVKCTRLFIEQVNEKVSAKVGEGI